ncbi:MAG: DNA starvation/stationary phase protection protein [Propionibacteriaceae bacterium]|jgi:starvation-inducible DNA-binding protein|nr:DNA starvation/stationary phase protection protein [Propionibacteriaceae bacterium]
MAQSVVVLQSVLVDLLDLGLIGKQAHWNVEGPAFRPVHLQLDEVVEQLLEWQDAVAERISALAGNPDGRPATIASSTSVAPLEGGTLRDVDVIKGFSDRLAAASKSISAKFADLADDLPSQDILVGIVAGLDKAGWFFRAQFA